MSYRIDADSVDEADEAVVLEVFSATNASLAGDAPVLRSTGWVLDDDGTGNNLALFVLGPDVKENLPGGAVASFDISLSRPAPRDLEFAFTTSNGTAEAGADYVATSGTIRFTEGQTRTAVNVPIIGDTLSEPDETFTLKVMPTGDLANGEAGTEGTATVVDNGPVMPPPELSIADGPDQAEGNAGTTLFSFTVTRSGDLSGASSADWSVAGVGADPRVPRISAARCRVAR